MLREPGGARRQRRDVLLHLRAIGGDQRNRAIVGPPLRREQPGHRLRVERIDREAVQRVGRQRDDAAVDDPLRGFLNRITLRELDRVSPLAVPVMLEIGRESVYGEAGDELLAEAADELVKEAMS